MYIYSRGMDFFHVQIFLLMANNYDAVAGYYDFLSRLVFGQAEINAQVELLEYLAPGSRVLIVGGGTGWILEKMAAVQPSGLRITYVESSARMMARSRQRNCGQNVVQFVELPVQELVTEERYDCVLTGFLFDNFHTALAEQIFSQLDALLVGGGNWLYADFYRPPKRKGKLWQAVLLRSMYIATRWLCKVEANQLPDMEAIFSEAGYRRVFTSFHYQRFIQGMVYRKRG